MTAKFSHFPCIALRKLPGNDLNHRVTLGKLHNEYLVKLARNMTDFTGYVDPPWHSKIHWILPAILTQCFSVILAAQSAGFQWKILEIQQAICTGIQSDRKIS
jgi:hypothetical protein